MPFAKPMTPRATRGEALCAPPRPEAPASAVLERLLGVVETLGRDVTVVPRSRHRVLCRHQTFGAVQETARGVVLGLYLPGILVGDRLMDGGSFRLNRVSHKVVLRSVEDIDEDVRRWLRQAYDRG